MAHMGDRSRADPWAVGVFLGFFTGLILGACYSSIL